MTTCDNLASSLDDDDDNDDDVSMTVTHSGHSSFIHDGLSIVAVRLGGGVVCGGSTR
jgi:hypothetical protein